MKKFMALLLVAGMTLSLTACGGSTDTAKTDQADGKDTFTVGFDQDFPPFGYVGDDGEFTGFDIEMATECAARMGKKIVLQPIDWDAKDIVKVHEAGMNERITKPVQRELLYQTMEKYIL